MKSEGKSYLKELIQKQSFLFEKVNQGDVSAVCYVKEIDEEYGVCDKNYGNRLKLAYYLLFKHIDCEEIIKYLFEEELKDRETNDFQGIGSSLEVLTFLLMRYEKDGIYDKLFQRAKDANFDCFCGYDKENKVCDDLEQYSLKDGIFLAIDMEDIETAEKLIELWKTEVIVWNKQNYQDLIWFQSCIKQEEKNEEPQKCLHAIALTEAKSEQEIISSWRNLISYYIRVNQCEKAYQSFKEMLAKVNLTSVYHIRLFDFLLEDCLELIVKYPEKAQELWEWVKPFLEEGKDTMFGNLYEKSIKAAEAVGDLFAKELAAAYDNWKKSSI